MKTIAIFIAQLLCFISVATASDHIDSAATIKNGQADLTDLYAFTTPSNPSVLTVLLNTYPGVRPNGHFSSKVSYSIFLRRAEAKTDLGFATSLVNRLEVRCQFGDPAHHFHSHGSGHSQTGTYACSLFQENSLLGELTGEVGQIMQNDYFKVYTGPRTDSFFISAETFIGVTTRKGFKGGTPGSGTNAMDTLNVLSIALELNMEKLGIADQTVALAAQSYTEKKGIKKALDRVGRPEITNLSLHDFSGNDTVKRSYNMVEPFTPPMSINSKYKQRLIDNISAYDMLDGEKFWSAKGLDELAELLVDDFLVISLGSSCTGQNSFLSMELQQLLKEQMASCGGRPLEDDIMTTLYALYIAGPAANRNDFETGVSAPLQGNSKKQLQDKFPYLPTPGTTGWIQWAKFKAAKFLQE